MGLPFKTLLSVLQRQHSVSCRMIVNFSQNITSKSLKISHPIFLISPKKFDKSRRWTEVGTND